MENQNIYYVYQIIDSRTRSIIYIGKGKNSRYLVHERRVKNNGKSVNPKLENKIKKIIETGHSLIYIFIRKNLSEEEAYDLEQKLTIKIGLSKLCNLKYGGTNGAKFTEEVRKKMKRAAILKDKSVYTNPERCRKISLAKKGIARSKETKKKLSNYWKGKSMVQRYGKERAKEIQERISQKQTGQKRPKQSLAMKGRFVGKKNPRFGKHQSEQFKEARRQYMFTENNPGKNKTEETKRRISEGRRGQPGHKHTEEFKKMISNVMKITWERRRHVEQQ